MKHVNFKLIIAFFAASLVFINNGRAQSDCKVLLDKIAGHYEGDCRKGLANGNGTAKGEDTYVGEFKKGLPDGTGTYTYANGDIYEGEFNKGEKDGKGKMSILQDDGTYKVQTGFWDDDEYVGEYENPYEVQHKSPGILSVRINKTENTAGDGDALFIEISNKGRIQQSPDFTLNETAGIMMSRYPSGMDTKIIISQFPFGFSLNYMGESTDILINQQGSWKIRIDFNK